MTTHERDDHDHGLQYDLQVMAERTRQRRRALGWLLSGGTVALIAACGGGGSDSDTTASSGDSSSGSGSSGGTSSGSTTCIANPEETQGPYPGDGSNTVNGMASNVLTESGIVRSDIQSSFGSSTTVAEGVPLTLTLNVVNSNTSCSALSGYAVYLWHCTREGAYSLYGAGIQDENFLRGVQVTDSNGQVTFETIFPAAYSGRYPHIHFEVYPSLALATLYTNKILTSQMALPRDICSTVYSGAAGYTASVSNLAAVTTASDNVFGDNTAAQIAQMTPALTGSVAAGYTGSILVGVPA
ncbi:MAG TPA: intradiol ring-cleavage dioxygenase [Steroidobacteraceae bacterium]|nr:intradiol ring-cleavage dioxygenase [Steroidobacteraceae bacterium]